MAKLRSVPARRAAFRRRIVGAAAVIATVCSISVWTGVRSVAAVQSPLPPLQQPTQPIQPGEPPLFGEPYDPHDPMQRQRLAKMEKARQADRQQQLVKDTDKLLDLAKQLKEQVDKSNKDTLSIDVVKKAAEIEKLAKSVKDRMRG
jgi:hypothetical protein